MDELIDILDSEGNLTGKTALKSEAHRNGLLHQTVHVWFFTSDGKILLQQRGSNKDTHPLLFDVSVAGHIGAGEKIKSAAIREVEEEIGLTISKTDLIKIGVFKSSFKHTSGLLDNELHHTYLCELKTSLQHLKKQESEVEALLLVTPAKLLNELKDANLRKNYVPHTLKYYSNIVAAIAKILK